MLLIQRNIDVDTYAYYFSNDAARLAFIQIRKRLTYTAVACLLWAAVVIIFMQA